MTFGTTGLPIIIMISLVLFLLIGADRLARWVRRKDYKDLIRDTAEMQKSDDKSK